MVKRPTWILLIVLALVIGAYFYLQERPLKATEPTPTAIKPSFLITKDNGALTKIHILDAQGNSLQMGRDASGNWTIMVGQSPTITQPEPAAANQSQAEAAETQFFALSVLTTLETSPALDVIGLNPPAYTITLGFFDAQRLLGAQHLLGGTQKVLEVGGLTPTGSGYYVSLEDKIYVISQSSINAVLGLLRNPPYAATPTIPATRNTHPRHRVGLRRPRLRVCFEIRIQLTFISVHTCTCSRPSRPGGLPARTGCKCLRLF
ncbi:MAG: hypothetical protein C0393_01370 [Anaerolinea sp.]|nr:hypothetical protein [Anaerolinea sp.]